MSARGRLHQWDPEALGDALEVVASALRAGLPPGVSLSIARGSTDWGRLEEARVTNVIDRLDRGLTTCSAWLLPSDEGEAADAYRMVGSVWDLALQTGGPLAEAVDYLTDHLREQARLHGRLEALAAGPRASARLLTLLPLVGPALAVLVGADPRDLYLSSPVAGGSAIIGLALTAVGWRWSRAMVRKAARPRRYARIDLAGQG
ncbi:MAG: type II secretion system F family protein [Dermatophilaceae bacterium]